VVSTLTSDTLEDSTITYVVADNTVMPSVRA
jgi:hypothetical protein